VNYEQCQPPGRFLLSPEKNTTKWVGRKNIKNQPLHAAVMAPSHTTSHYSLKKIVESMEK